MSDLAPVLLLAADNPLDHVVNHPFWTPGGWWVWSSHIGNLVLTGIIMLVFFPRWARRTAGETVQGNEKFLPGGRGPHLFECFCVYLRDTIVRPVLGPAAEAYMPLLWTLFFFILINNLLGLVPVLEVVAIVFAFVRPEWVAEHRAPFGATATGNIWVTAALALLAGVVYIAHGFRNLGPAGFLRHMTGGAPVFVWPIIIPIEIMGTFVIKTGALAIRLFANMTAGHLLVATLFMFVSMSIRALPWWGAAPISLLSVVGVMGVYVLELFVGVLQAFIFMFLTAIFIGQLSHHGHEHEHGHGAPAH
jgi:F-type H+-transporting ATPase subunit a